MVSCGFGVRHAMAALDLILPKEQRIPSGVQAEEEDEVTVRRGDKPFPAKWQ